MYDDENLYFAWTCEEPNIDKLKASETGRDGPAWAIDCVELFLDPESSAYSRRYYHFIVGAVKNALYDDRTGFKTPGDQDDSWNAEGFKYGYNIDRGNKRWSIEMLVPFKDIATTTPKPGDVWLGNFARERYAGVNELYQWSQGGAGGFVDPKSFGKIRFE